MGWADQEGWWRCGDEVGEGGGGVGGEVGGVGPARWASGPGHGACLYVSAL